MLASLIYQIGCSINIGTVKSTAFAETIFKCPNI